MVGVAGAIAAPSPKHSPSVSCAHPVRATQGVALAKAVWPPDQWRRGKPDSAAIKEHRNQVRCAVGPGHRVAIKRSWNTRRAKFYKHRHKQLARLDINHRWDAHWAPDFSGPTLPLYVIAALAEKAGDTLGIDVPGWTMAQMTIGESGRRPGSAGVDAGGTFGVGLWAVTSPFANRILAKWGWSYDDMQNPVRNAVVMTEIYAAQGLGAWYGDSHVTARDAHYRGRFDLRLVLGGLSFRQALGARQHI